MTLEPMSNHGNLQAAGYGPPGGGYPPGGGGGYGGPPPGAPPGGGGYGGPPPGGGPPGGYGGPPGGGPPGGPPPGGGYGAPPPGGYGGPPPGGGFGPPGGGFPPPGGPMMPGAGGDVNTTLPLVLSIIAAVFCCGLGSIPAIIGIVFSVQAGNAKKAGDLETARSKAKTATILAIVAFALGLLANILYAAMNAR